MIKSMTVSKHFTNINHTELMVSMRERVIITSILHRTMEAAIYEMNSSKLKATWTLFFNVRLQVR